MDRIIPNGREIKIARMKKGFGASSFAEKIGVTGTMIGLIETEKTGVSPETAKKITDELGKEFDDLFRIESTEGKGG